MRLSISHAILSGSLTLACGRQSGDGGPPPETPHGSETSLANEASSPEPKASGSADSDRESQPNAELGAGPPESTGFDLDTWAEQHQIEISIEADGCEPAELGDKPNEVIWCRHRENRAEGAVLYLRALYAARAKKLVKLIEIPYGVGQVALESKRDAGDRMLLKLEFNRASDGKSVEVADGAELDCAKANQENAEIKDTAPSTHTAFDKVIRKVCAARGHYRWAAGTLRRAP
jgi:hypothetical protein